MKSNLQQIERLIDLVLDAIRRAADRHDIAALPDLSRLSQSLIKLKERFERIEQELAEIEVECSHLCSATNETTPKPMLLESYEPDGNSQSEPTIPENRVICRLVVNVTQGMINQNLLTLTDHVKAGRIRTGMEMKIEARPSGELFSSTLLSEGNRLQERGAIARFYREARVRAGDRVVLLQIAENRWKLEKVNSTAQFTERNLKIPSGNILTVDSADDRI